MHGEHFDGVLAAALAEVHFEFRRLQAAQKSGHAPLRLFRKAQDAAQAQLPFLFGKDLRFEPVRKEHADRLARRPHAGEQAVMLRKREEIVETGGERVVHLFRIRAAGGAEGGRGGEADAHGGKVALREPAEDGEHRPRHGDVLFAVVEEGEPVEDETRFPEIADVDVRRGGDRDARVAERAHGARRRAPVGARKHGDVAVPDGTFLPFVGVEPHRAELLFDEPHDGMRQTVLLPFGLRGEHGVDAALARFPLFGRRNEHEAHFAPVFPVARAAPHLGGIFVIEPARLLRHRAGKDGIDGFEHGGRGAETFAQREREGEFLGLLQEILRTAAAEGIDRLLRIADEEDFLPAREAQKLLLHEVDVLIFVHEHIAVFLPDGGADVLVPQHAQGAVFEVVIVEKPRLPFERKETGAVGKSERGERAGTGGSILVAEALRLFALQRAQLLFECLERFRDRFEP